MSSLDVRRAPSVAARPSPAAAGLALVLVALFVIVADEVALGRTLAFDLAAHRVVYKDIGPRLEGVMKVGPLLGTSALLCAPLMIVWLLYHRRLSSALALSVSEAGAFVLYVTLKGLFHRVRLGDAAPANVFGYLFPSGHALASIVTFGLLGYLIAVRCRGWARAGVVVATAGVVAFVALSLVYLDTHYITDVLGGLVVGGAWLTLSITGLRLVEAPSR